MRATSIRTRWSAIGAAVAVTLGSGGIGLVAATSPSDAVAYRPITPCRMVDTRSNPDVNVGTKDTPIGPGETHTIAAIGPDDECTEIPKNVAGLQLNVTALNATAPTFLSVWGTGDQPNASSLNPVPGQPPTPNAVTTGLDGDGEFHVFNKFGFVDVIVDVVGTYTDHHHDDRYYTKTQTDSQLATKPDSSAVYTQDEVDDLLSAQRVIAEAAFHGAGLRPLGTDTFTEVEEVVVEVPSAGSIQVTGSAYVTNADPTVSRISCGIERNGVGAATMTRRFDGPTGSCSTNGTFFVGAGTHTITLMVRTSGGDGWVQPSTLDALYVPHG